MKTEVLKVTGMTCGGCVTKVTQALKATAGVNDANVSLAAGEATVKFDERLTSVDNLDAAVKLAGYNKDTTRAAHGQQTKGRCCG